MRELEHRFPDVLTIVGVQSGKYHTERLTDRIRDAALRLGNTHPIVNDRQFRVWRSYAVSAWPTIVILDADGRVVGSHAGEFTADALAPVVERLAADARARGTLRGSPVHFAADAPTMAPERLRFPGKVVVNGERLAIADTGHHEVIVARLDAKGTRARVERLIGRGTPGLEDGTPGAFDSPQGMALDEDTLWVADAETHTVRVVDLASGAVRTVAGIGRQMRTRADMREGALSSPWDVTKVGDTLFVAMAGIHQLWSVDVRTGEARPHSGSFREDIADGPHAQAALAQPMGITTDGTRLFFVDAESSAVRWADVNPEGRVGTIVGTGLFDFGDRDGVSDEALLQHPQGIARHPDGRLLVADSYNDALKWVDVDRRAVTTWVRGLHEPSGVAIGATHAYVADTNAHRIAAVSLANGTVEELELV